MGILGVFTGVGAVWDAIGSPARSPSQPVKLTRIDLWGLQGRSGGWSGVAGDVDQGGFKVTLGNDRGELGGFDTTS